MKYSWQWPPLSQRRQNLPYRLFERVKGGPVYARIYVGRLTESELGGARTSSPADAA